jgi:hypothetical protein
MNRKPMSPPRFGTKMIPVLSTVWVALFVLSSAPRVFSQDIKVTSADPPSAPQGTVNLNVTIRGSGFKKGAQANFFITGTGDPGGIGVNQTTFVTSTELVANIDIADTAVISKFDIEVLSNGRRGKGTELFAVTEKGSGGAATCDLSQPTPSGFNLLQTLTLESPRPARFGDHMAGRQVNLTLNGKVAPIVLAVSDDTTVAEGGGPGTINLYLLDPDPDNTPGTPEVGVSRLLDGSSNPVKLPVDANSGTLLLANLDGNEAPDFISASRNSPVEIFIGDDAPPGTLRYVKHTIPLPSDISVEFFGTSAAAADIDGDGLDEIAVGASGTSTKSPPPGKVLIYDYDGTQFFTRIQVIDSSTFGLGNADLFGASVALGDIDNRFMGPELIVGAPYVKVGKLTNAGQVFVFPPSSGVGFDVPGRYLLAQGSTSKDMLGSRLAAVPAGTVHDVAVSTGLQSTQTRADHYRFQFGSSPSKDFSLVAGTQSGGWATGGVVHGDIDGNGTDYLIGVPNASCGNSLNLGQAYVYLNPVASSSPVPPSGTFLPTLLDPDWNAFGWSAAAISADIGATRHSLVLIGEPGRDIGGQNKVGQVYIYRFTRP